MRLKTSASSTPDEPGVHRRDRERRGLVARDVDAVDRRGDLAVADGLQRAPGPARRRAGARRVGDREQREARGTRAARCSSNGTPTIVSSGSLAPNVKPNRLNGVGVAAVEAAGQPGRVEQDVLADEHQADRGDAEVDAAQAAGDRAVERARQARERDREHEREQRREPEARGRADAEPAPRRRSSSSRTRRPRRRTRARARAGPAVPVRIVRPIAPIAAAIANRPVCSQNASRKNGTSSATTHRATATSRPGRPGRASDTGQLLRAEQAGGPPPAARAP